MLVESGENTVMTFYVCFVLIMDLVKLWNLVVSVIMYTEACTNVCVYTRFRLGVAGALIVFMT